jgi:hypothetical protein
LNNCVGFSLILRIAACCIEPLSAWVASELDLYGGEVPDPSLRLRDKHFSHASVIGREQRLESQWLMNVI